MSLTIKKIAELANTSRGTVDRVINHRGGVNKETEERILEIIKIHDYKYNEYARALVQSNKIYKIGIVLTAYNSDFYTRVLKGIRHAITKEKNKQLEVIVKVINYSVKNQIGAINELLDLGISGLIINPIYHDKIKNKLSTLNIPLITIANDLELENELAFVGCDYYSNGVIASDLYYAVKTDNKILMVVGSSHPKAVEKRLKGFKDNLSETIEIDYLYTNDTDIDTYKKVKEYYNKFNTSLIYSATGNGIGGLIQALDEKKVNVKLITVDEHPDVINGFKNNKVTVTITQQPEKQGIATLDIMRKYLTLKEFPKNKHYVIGNKIKVKHSNFNEAV